MKTKDIDSIAYLIKKAKRDKKPMPIILLGAGASVSAGMPATEFIMNDISNRFSNKPEVRKLREGERNYYSLMKCLNTDERHTLLRSYITDSSVRINVTHIYLAQLLKEEYADYILTVNFDDLLLRACALFNFLPPDYDVATQKDFTTTNLLKRSVVYLHGQHFGFWLLNTDEELKRVKSAVNSIFNKICHQRTWIVVGYSGQDPIFEMISGLGRFDNELFWVGYKDKEPEVNVQEKLLRIPNMNASWVKGYDSDTFFLKLNTALGLPTPEIFNKPFTFLNSVIGNIKDIDETKGFSDNFKELFMDVKKRLETSKKWVDDAVFKYEHVYQRKQLGDPEIHKDKLKQEIIEANVSRNFDKASGFYKKAMLFNDTEINKLLSDLYMEWGVKIYHKSRAATSEKIINQRIEKYKIAAELNPDNSNAFNNWGNAISELADFRASEDLYLQAIEKYKIAVKLNPKDEKPLSNWGTTLTEIALLKKDETLFKDIFKKHKTASELNPENHHILNNWSNDLIRYSNFLTPENKKKYLKKAEAVALRVHSLVGHSYNLACIYALLNNKENALKYLDEAMSNSEINWDYALMDEDWKAYYSDKDFVKLIKNYKNIGKNLAELEN